MKTTDFVIGSMNRPGSDERDGHLLEEASVRPLGRKISTPFSPLTIALASGCLTFLLLRLAGTRMNCGDNSTQVDLAPASIVALFAFALAHLFLWRRHAIGHGLRFQAWLSAVLMVVLLPAVTFCVCAVVSAELRWSYGVALALLPANALFMSVAETLAAWGSHLRSSQGRCRAGERAHAASGSLGLRAHGR
jgi:hypothetical protein